MGYAAIILGILYLCGVKVGVALAISSIILGICSIILARNSERYKKEIELLKGE